MERIEIGDQTLTTGEIQDLLATDHPMVTQFRFEAVRGRDRENLSFALHIIPRAGVRYLQQRDARGRRVRPNWQTLTGQEVIGQGNRSIWLEGDELVAENSTFFPNQEFNDLGIGSALYVSMERLYRRLGIRRVTLLAVDVGVYVWARQGFGFAERGTHGSFAGDLKRFVREHDRSLPFNRSRFEHSWDFANYDLPGVEIDKYRLGKAFMLSEASPWYGTKHLGDDLHDEIAEASRRETFSRLPYKIDGATPDLAVR